MNTETINAQHIKKSCIIWMHGLGADANDMKSLTQALNVPSYVKHVCLDAPIQEVTINNHIPMRAWYDITGSTLTDREDSKGILESYKLILNAISAQIEAGFQAENIFLAGFSQGGAMALYVGLACEQHLGGIISLSAYLPLSDALNPQQDSAIPIFMGFGEQDNVVLSDWSILSIEKIKSFGYQNITAKGYLMGHEVCHQELVDLNRWLNLQLTNA